MKKMENLDCISILSKKQMKDVKGGMDLVGTISLDKDLSPKEKACKGKGLCASCSWEYNGKTYKGQCSQFAGVENRWCSDLRCFQ